MFQLNFDHLCASCSRLKFQNLFFSPESNDEPMITRTLQHIRQATYCPFCRLTLNALNSDPEVQILDDALCIMYHEQFGSIVSSEQTVESTRKLLIRSYSEVESLSDSDYNVGLNSILPSTASTQPTSTVRPEHSIGRLWFTISVDEKGWTITRHGTMFVHGVQVCANQNVKRETKYVVAWSNSWS